MQQRMEDLYLTMIWESARVLHPRCMDCPYRPKERASH